MLVRSILQEKGADVVTVGADAPVAEAARLLVTERIGALVIVDGLTITGILSERDIVRGLAQQGASVLDSAVRSLMTTSVTTCAPEDDLDALMSAMTERRVRHLPVVDGDGLAGIVSIGDVVKHRVQELRVEAQTLHDYIETGR